VLVLPGELLERLQPVEHLSQARCRRLRRTIESYIQANFVCGVHVVSERLHIREGLRPVELQVFLPRHGAFEPVRDARPDSHPPDGRLLAGFVQHRLEPAVASQAGGASRASLKLRAERAARAESAQGVSQDGDARRGCVRLKAVRVEPGNYDRRESLTGRAVRNRLCAEAARGEAEKVEARAA